MGSSESKTQEILAKKIQQMSGDEILDAAGGIHCHIEIIPDKVQYTFGETISGKIILQLNKPIFFVEEGFIQLTLEGKEIMHAEDIELRSGQAQPPRVNHQEKFFRARQVVFNQ